MMESILNRRLEARDVTGQERGSTQILVAHLAEACPQFVVDSDVRENLIAFLQNDAAGMEQQVVSSASQPEVEDELLGLEADTVAYGAALALAYAGDIRRAQELTDDLDKKFGEATIVQFNYLPTLRAMLALSNGGASKAIDALRAAALYELGVTTSSTYSWNALYPVFVRGEAYLSAGQASEAAAEFQKVLDHRGAVVNEPIGALAHLQLGRAYAMQGDTTKARAAYQDFLTLWKDADPDIPIYKQAKAEYVRLK